MFTYLYYVCQVRHVTPRIVFEQAYEKHYGVKGDVSNDFFQFERTHVLPVYVLGYLEDIRAQPRP